MSTEWGVRYQRNDGPELPNGQMDMERAEWTPLVVEWPTLREARAHAMRLHNNPSLFRRVRIVKREVSAWREQA